MGGWMIFFFSYKDGLGGWVGGRRYLGLVLPIGLEFIGKDAGLGGNRGDVDGGNGLGDLDVRGHGVLGHELEGGHGWGSGWVG